MFLWCSLALASTNIWLYHVLHDKSTLFSFQRTPLLFLRGFRLASRESASIWYLEAFALSRRNLKFFFEALASLALPGTLCFRCLLPTCNILHAFFFPVNTFLKYFLRRFHAANIPFLYWKTSDSLLTMTNLVPILRVKCEIGLARLRGRVYAPLAYVFPLAVVRFSCL